LSLGTFDQHPPLSRLDTSGRSDETAHPGLQLQLDF